MVFIDVADLAIIIGLFLGGRLSALGDISLRGKGLAFCAIGLQIAAFPPAGAVWSTPTNVSRILWLASYALLIGMLVLNRRLTGAPIVGLGLLCNLAAIVTNGGLMPVREAALRATGSLYKVHNNSIELTKPHLAFLVDRWATPTWIPLGNVFSVGDVLIALGTGIAIVAAMRRPTGFYDRKRRPIKVFA